MRWIALVALLGGLFVYDGLAERSELSLDGTWKIAFDEANQSRAETWYMPASFANLESVESIDVPSCWETIRQDYEGVAVYGRSFTVPSEWKGQAIRLQFDAVNFRADVWLNGHAIGQHEGGYGPFEFQVDDLIDWQGTNFLSVRVLGPIIEENKTIDGLGRNDAPHWRGAITGGIWQSVRLIASGSVMISDLFVIPVLDQDMARVELSLENSGLLICEEQVIVEVEDGETGEVVAREERTIRLKPGVDISEWVLSMPDAKRWSPDAPNLYRVRAMVVEQDEQEHRFGMRELTIQDNEFILNGSRYISKRLF